MLLKFHISLNFFGITKEALHTGPFGFVSLPKFVEWNEYTLMFMTAKRI